MSALYATCGRCGRSTRVWEGPGPWLCEGDIIPKEAWEAVTRTGVRCTHCTASLTGMVVHGPRIKPPPVDMDAPWKGYRC